MPITKSASRIRFVYAFSFDSYTGTGPDSRFKKLCDAATNDKVVVTSRDKADEESNPVWETRGPIEAEWAEPAVGKSTREGLRGWKLSKGAGQTFLKIDDIEWFFVSKKTSEQLEIKVKIKDITLNLMKHGVGLIAIDVWPQTKDLDEWVRVLTDGRRAARGSRQSPTGFVARNSRWNQETKERSYELQWPPAMQVKDQEDSPQALIKVMEYLLGRMSNGGQKFWENVLAPGLLIPYYTLVADVEKDTAGPLLFQLSRLARSRDDVQRAAGHLFADETDRIQIAECTHVIASGISIGYITTSPGSTYIRETIPGSLFWGECWTLFLLAMQQRVLLQDVATEIPAAWAEVKGRERPWYFPRLFFEAGRRQLRIKKIAIHEERLLEFMSDSYFPRVSMQAYLFRDIYDLLSRQFELKATFEQTWELIEAIHGKLRYQQQAFLEGLIRKLGIPMAISAAITGFLGINIVYLTSAEDGLPWELALALSLGFPITIFILLELAQAWWRSK